MKVNGSILGYSQYMTFLRELVSKDKTSGEDQTASFIQFTKINLKRMERLNKTIDIQNNLKNVVENLGRKQIWYVIAEVWCGDCAQNLPVIGKLAELSNGLIDLRIIQRDENPNWMEKYSTNGAKAIPKLISFNSFGQELFTWGARPRPAQELLNNWKSNLDGISWDAFETQLHTWYAQDKTITQQNEFYEKLQSIYPINKVVNSELCSYN